jgi:hypothetical protein
MKKDAYYFPHFSNARNDAKIIKLRRVMGLEGYAIYFMLLEILREQTDFRYEISGIDDLSYEWHVSREKIFAVISNFDLFEILDHKFFSTKLILYLQPYIEKSENARQAVMKRWNNVKNQLQMNTNVDTNVDTNVLLTLYKESKGEESKEKESKVNKIEIKPEIEISDAPSKIEIINSEKKSKLKQQKNYKEDFPPKILNLLAQVVKEFPENIIAKLTPAQKWNWCKTIKDLNEIDKYDLQTIFETILFARNNDFWKANLLSVASLRDKKKNCELTKFDKINAQRIAGNGSGNTSIIDNFTDEYLKNHSLKYKNNN